MIVALPHSSEMSSKGVICICDTYKNNFLYTQNNWRRVAGGVLTNISLMNIFQKILESKNFHKVGQFALKL